MKSWKYIFFLFDLNPRIWLSGLLEKRLLLETSVFVHNIFAMFIFAHLQSILLAIMVLLCSSSLQAFHRVRCRASPNILLSFSGKHGSNFKYLPILQGDPDEPFPRIIHIAGIYPHLTVEQLFAPVSPQGASAGAWSYDFGDPDGPQLGSVALPGSGVITACIDPVVVIAKNSDLGVAAVEEVEMIVVIDRGDRDFVTGKFYIFLTPEQTLDIRWMETLEEGYTVLGRVALCAMPFTESMRPKATGFLEDE
jgi:hypothetical protein